LITLALTAGPTIYIAFFNNGPGQLPLILGIVQFFISAVVFLLFSIMPSGRMFGDRVAGRSRKYLASQTFTASYPGMDRSNRVVSLMLWTFIFGFKFVESYFFLTLSFKDPIRTMVRMTIHGCNDKLFGTALCANQAAFTLAIMYVMDLVLFFLDTFLWYVIWNTVFSIARSFKLGLSIWTPWEDIFTRLPKRIYSKILATGDMEVKYKPKVGAHSFPLPYKGSRLYLGACQPNLERHHHFDVPRASSLYRSRTKAALPSTGFRTGRSQDSSRSSVLHQPGR
jgi:1,3-beta-glucan synthase